MRYVRKAVNLALWAIVLFVAFKLGSGIYYTHLVEGTAGEDENLPDYLKVCRIEADTQQCWCYHWETGKRLKINHEQCLSLALNPQHN